MAQLCISEVARMLKARPKDITDLFYRRRLSDGLCPVIGGRRLIPESYVPVIERTLRSHGRPVGNDNIDHEDADPAGLTAGGP